MSLPSRSAAGFRRAWNPAATATRKAPGLAHTLRGLHGPPVIRYAMTFPTERETR